VCQHIHWKKLLGFWEYLGIKNIHLSHLTKSIKNNSIASFSPWHLIAPNAEIPVRNKGLRTKSTKDKKYLCSFVGAILNNYRSDIRHKLESTFTSANKNKLRKDVVFQVKNRWFYDGAVYTLQVRGLNLDPSYLESHALETKNFNETVSDSLFVACPEGSGPNTLRIWESMSVGSIPILFENDWERPTLDGLSWDDFSFTIEYNKVNDLFNFLNEIPDSLIEEMSRNCINAYNEFRIRTCF
ncbi:MAG: hypothetical protein EB127_27790, partial [Alphaproteobacteria bacterium]|nr:hypothetical protein [Alphaproteobacteria bacterium]